MRALTNRATMEGKVASILDRHLQAFLEHNMENLLSDYTDETMLITPTGSYRGREEIRGFFTGLMEHFPKGQQGFQLDKTIVVDETALIVWHASTPSVEVRFATDTFLLKGDKIYLQTFAGELNFRG